MSELAQRAKAAWARLIRKVYEAHPLQCPKCKGPTRVIALIDHPGVIRHILEHLGLWAPEAPERGPPGQAPEWPANALIPLNRSMRALISIRWFLLSLLLEVALRGILWALHSGDRARRLRCWWLVSH